MSPPVERSRNKGRKIVKKVQDLVEELIDVRPSGLYLAIHLEASS
jgi:hypothetical protein